MTAAEFSMISATDAGQVMRRRQFEAAHPHVTILFHADVLGGSFWYATFPQDQDMRTVIGPPLKDLLDKLDDVFRPDG